MNLHYKEYFLNNYANNVNATKYIEKIYKKFLKEKSFDFSEDEKKILILHHLRNNYKKFNLSVFDKDRITSDLKILEVISSGKVGIIYKCFDVKRKKVVIVKELKPDNRSEKFGSFLMEIIHALKLPVYHHNFNGISYILKSGNDYLSVSDYVPGKSLNEFTYKDFRKEHIYSIVYQICAALNTYSGDSWHLGFENINVHGDLHGGNIILKHDGTPVIIDWGQSSVKASRNSVFPNIAPEILPERIRKKIGLEENVSSKIDVWGLGVTLFKLFTGTFPYHVDKKGVVIDDYSRSINKDDRRILDIPSSYHGLVPMMVKMLAIKPEDRISFQDVIDELDASGVPIDRSNEFYSELDSSNGKLSRKYLKEEELKLKSLLEILIYDYNDINLYVNRKNISDFDFKDRFIRFGLKIYHGIKNDTEVDKLSHMALSLFNDHVEYAWNLLNHICHQEENADTSDSIEGIKWLSNINAMVLENNYSGCMESRNDFDISKLYSDQIAHKLLDLAAMSVNYKYSWDQMCADVYLQLFLDHPYLLEIVNDIIGYLIILFNEKTRITSVNPETYENADYSEEFEKLACIQRQALFVFSFIESYYSRSGRKREFDYVNMLRKRYSFSIARFGSRIINEIRNAYPKVYPFFIQTLNSLGDPVKINSSIFKIIKSIDAKTSIRESEKHLYGFIASVEGVVAILQAYVYIGEKPSLRDISKLITMANSHFMQNNYNLYASHFTLIELAHYYFYESIGKTSSIRFRNKLYSLHKYYLECFGNFIGNMEWNIARLLPEHIADEEKNYYYFIFTPRPHPLTVREYEHAKKMIMSSRINTLPFNASVFIARDHLYKPDEYRNMSNGELIARKVDVVNSLAKATREEVAYSLNWIIIIYISELFSLLDNWNDIPKKINYIKQYFAVMERAVIDLFLVNKNIGTEYGIHPLDWNNYDRLHMLLNYFMIMKNVIILSDTNDRSNREELYSITCGAIRDIIYIAKIKGMIILYSDMIRLLSLLLYACKKYDDALTVLNDYNDNGDVKYWNFDYNIGFISQKFN